MNLCKQKESCVYTYYTRLSPGRRQTDFPAHQVKVNKHRPNVERLWRRCCCFFYFFCCSLCFFQLYTHPSAAVPPNSCLSWWDESVSHLVRAHTHVGRRCRALCALISDLRFLHSFRSVPSESQYSFIRSCREKRKCDSPACQTEPERSRENPTNRAE